MGRKKKAKSGNPLKNISVPEINIGRETKRGIIVVCVILLGVLSLLSLFDLSGSFGNILARGQELAFGWGRWVFPFLLIFWGIFLYRENKGNVKGAGLLGIFLFFISIFSLLHFFLPFTEWKDAAKGGYGGGLTGLYLALVFRNILGFWGGLVGILAILMISLLLLFNASLVTFFGEGSFISKIFSPFKSVFDKFFNDRNKYEETEEAEEATGESENYFSTDGEKEAAALEFTKRMISDSPDEPDFLQEKEDKEIVIAKEGPAKVNKEEGARWKINPVKIDLPIELLDRSSGKPTSGDVKNNALVIARTLENFGIPVSMADTAVGPTVTQYSFKPAEGVKLSRITTLSNDLALALAAHPIRIEAPIPGKALVGVEVPNKTKAIVSLREVLEGDSFKTAKSNLTVALGKDVAGGVWSYDIGKMPHLLVAGATGSGKSVCLNAIILSLLYRNGPEDLRFIFIDPKRVELTVYDGIPHLLTPVITNVNKTVNALRWCLNEMDRRFELLAQNKKRNIDSYNKTVRNKSDKMPFIIFIIDELADLMVAASKDIESSVIRLTQMARAVGIHLILATQRPSVDVITGLIKANTPARIAFSVASAVDSKTILDTQGAEKLLGKGDMLFLTAEISKPKRLQGAFVSDEEIKRVVDYIKEKSGNFEYVEGITDRQKVGGIAGVGLEGNINDEVDDLFVDAREIVVSSGKASTSLLQRRLAIGYARAARIMDELEEAGVIGPSNGAKPREILMSREQIEMHDSAPTAGATLHSREDAQAPDSYLGDDEDDNSLGEAPEAPVAMGDISEDEKTDRGVEESSDVEKVDEEKKVADDIDGNSEQNEEEKNGKSLSDEDEMFFAK